MSTLVEDQLVTQINRLTRAVQLGIVMRIAQKRFFGDRTDENLKAAKDAEMEFDKAASLTGVVRMEKADGTLGL